MLWLFELSIWGYELRVTGCELRVTGYELRVTGYELRVVDCEFLYPVPIIIFLTHQVPHQIDSDKNLL